MWGCLRTLALLIGGGLVLLLLVVGSGWWYVGTTSFADLVRLRIEATLEARLGREVTIGSVVIVRSRPQKVILNDLRIANAPGGVAPYFATVRQVEITGGVESFWQRSIRVGRVDVRDPRLFYEIYPEGAPLTHNFPQWKRGAKRRYEILRMEIGQLFVERGAFSFNDRKHQIVAVASDISSRVNITSARNLYAGVMQSPRLHVRVKDYEAFDVAMRGGFRYTPGVLGLESIALRGRGIEAFLSGSIDPLTEAVYDLRLTSRIELERVREIFRVEKALGGTLALDTRLRGKKGEFTLEGGWRAPAIEADTYELADAEGTLKVTPESLTVGVERAVYGGGTIDADYVLSKMAEPYPMSIDLRYAGISIEKLFADWGVEGTGLRGGATGRLEYRWNKDRVLAGAGEGTARLARNATAFSDARYPIPVAGTTAFGLDNGVVAFRSMELDTEASHIALSGKLKIEGLVTDLAVAIRSNDFAELDRIAYNFAHALDKDDFELLGLGGSGTISGTVRGPMDSARVDASVSGTAVRYNEVLLGNAAIDLAWDGTQSTLRLAPAVFTDAGGRLTLEGTITFPDRGPGPRFDLALEASGYPAQRAIEAAGLDLEIGPGLATGRMIIAGTPETGRATFAGLKIRRADATLALDGTLNWLPGEGKVSFDLQIAANDFPVEDIAAFLDLGELPVSGALTGTLRLEGPKESLEGSGSVTVRSGAIAGEPIELATADIEFTSGRMRARNVFVRSAAGEIRGEAEMDFASEQFSYTITESRIDVSKIKALEALAGLFGGTLVVTSAGAGSLDDPEIVLEARLENATLSGATLPEGSAPPSLYLAVRGGRLIIRGSIAEVVTIEGEGTLGPELAIDAMVRATVTDVAKALTIWPATSTLPASGNLVIDARLGGRLSPIEALVAEVTVPVFDVELAGHEFVAPEPLRLDLRDGRLQFTSFALQRPDSAFTVTGFVGISGTKPVDLQLRGRVDAAVLQLFAQDVHAEGEVDVAMSIAGTLTAPRMLGTAQLIDAELKFAGFPQLIDEINGRLEFRGDRINIESLRATVGGGSVVAGGFITLDGMKPETFRVTLQGTEVNLRYYEGLALEGNFTLLLTGDLERALLAGDIAVTRAFYFRDFELQQALLNVLLARDRITPIAAATWQDRLGLRLTLSAPGTLAVTNNIAEVTGSAELEVGGTIANPVILGEVVLDEGGTVRIQNVDYQLNRGTITFQNPFRIDPFFDITVEGTVSGGASELEGGPLQVTINLTGTLDRLTPTITSDPPASDITLFSVLGLGGLGSQTGTGGGVGVLGESLLYQSLSSLIGSRVFPFVDSFAYDPGNLETGSGAGAKVTFEKRLSNKIRFLVVYNLENQESRQVVEWMVNPTWTLQLTRDETDEYRLDARFRRRYEGYWRMGEEETTMAPAAMVTGSAETVTRPAVQPVTAVDASAWRDQPVAQINFVADALFDTTAMVDEVTLAPGDPLTLREVQTSIRQLYSTGRFRDIRVNAAAAPSGGVLVTFSLFLHYRVGEIEIAGLGRSDLVRARRELRIRTGEILSLDSVDDSAVAIQEMLQERGYLEAIVDPETEFDRERSIADVVLHVTPGPRALVADVVIEGDPAPFNAEQLIGEMRSRPGRAFDRREAREDADRIRNHLVRKDYRRAEVEYLDYTYDEEADRVTLHYRVETGPLVRVAVSGVPPRSVRRWLPFARNQEYSEDVVDQAADAIVRGLQERGHFLATVDTESALEDGVWTTTFHVDPGARYELSEVRFSGNEQIDDDELRDVVQTSPSGGIRQMLRTLFRRPSGVTRQQLSDDQEAIESYYRLNGFASATAATPIAVPQADGSLLVEFPVEEGPQTLVASVALEGNEDLTAEALPELLLREGDPLNPQALHDDVVALQSHYASRGYVEIQVTPRVDVSEDQTSASVRYVVAEGPEVLLNEVTVRGNTYTDRDVVLRKAELEPGEPFSYTSLLEAQRDLYRLGIFNRVEVQARQAGTAVGTRDVVIQVEEGRNLALTGAVGLRAQRGDQENGGGSGEDNPSGGGDGMVIRERIAGAVAHRNLFGTGRYLGFEGVYSRDEQEAYLTYREPFVSRWNVPVQLQIFQSDDSTRNGVTILQKGTSIEATKIARLQTRWSLRYEYRISECRKGRLCGVIREGLPVENLDRSLLDIEISSITPTFFWDTRDDILDPRRGFFTSASVEYAFPLLSAESNFLKEFVQGAWYLPVSDRTVFAFSGRLGLIHPLGGTTAGDVPLSERFTAGGENSHRAFGLGRLGDLCKDENFADIAGCTATLYRETPGSPTLPIGGSGLLMLNAEYRFPIFSTLGGAIFADAGNVYATDTIRFDELRYGVGFGLRYLSPVGPLRVDIGFPLDRRWYEESFQYFVTLGYAF